MPASNQKVKLLKGLIWTYLILLLMEGAMRKWMLPSWSNVLLIIRDFLVILIYPVAMACRRFVVNGFVAANFLLAAATFCASLLVPDVDVRISLVGLRCYFLHLPLIFVIERTLDKEDIWRICKFLLWFAIPETVLLVAQFKLPQTNWVNFNIGGQITEGFSGAEGHARPSGTFSFHVGVAALYPLIVAALMGFLITRHKIPLYLTLAAAVCTAIAIPVSINRTNAVTCALVLIIGGAAVLRLPSPPKQILRVVLFVGVVLLVASQLPNFDEGVEAFQSRWTSATGTDISGFQSNIIMRFINDLFPSPGLLFDTPVLGYGVGIGTPMGQGLLTGSRKFALGESEWPRLILEMGPVLGVAFILLRVGLCARLVRVSLVSLRRENIWPILFTVEAFFLVLNASWGQATILGFATFSAGLAFAASHMTKDKPKSAKTPPPKTEERQKMNWTMPVREPALPSGSPENLS